MDLDGYLDDNTVRLLDAFSGKQIGKPMSYEGRVQWARVSPDGQRVLTVLDDNTVRIRNALSGEQIGGPMQHERNVNFAEFSPNGRWVMTSDLTRGLWRGPAMVRLWEAASGNEIGEPMKFGIGEDYRDLSPDGQWVVTVSNDNAARLWNVTTGQPIGKLPKAKGKINSVKFSPDAHRMIVVSDDTVQLWDIPVTTIVDRPEDVLLLADLAEASSGVALPRSRSTEILNILPTNERIALLEKVAITFEANSQSLTPLQRFLKWSVSDRWNRTISPFSELTVAEWVENRINESALDGLHAAVLLDSGNARLAAHYGRRLADHALAKVIDPDAARRARGEAEFQTRRALKLAPDNVEVKKLRAEVATRFGDQDHAQSRTEEARKEYEEALAIYRWLAAKNPEAYRAEIERTLELLGTVQRKLSPARGATTRPARRVSH